MRSFEFYGYLRIAMRRRAAGAYSVWKYAVDGDTPERVGKKICRAADQGKLEKVELDWLLERLGALRDAWRKAPVLQVMDHDDWRELPGGGHMRIRHGIDDQ